eukprot:32007_1
MAYTAISTQADEDDFVPTNLSNVSITPLARYSSSDVIAAAEELHFKQSTHDLPVDTTPKNAYQTLVHMMNLRELETELKTSLEYGLNDNQVQMKREDCGYNIMTPPSKQHCLLDCFKDISLMCLIIPLILCLVITILIPNVYSIVFTTITFIPIILLILLIWCNRNVLNQQRDQEISPETKTVTVKRKQLKLKYQLLIHAMMRENINNPPSVITELIWDYYCNSVQNIDIKELLIGDIVHVKAGEMIPADLRIIECSDNCHIDNSCLTGESEPQKRNSEISNDILSEAPNILFYGTYLVEGNATGICYKIGDSTFMGKTASLCAYESDLTRIDATIRTCKRTWSSLLCMAATIFFIVLLAANTNHHIIFLIWFILTVVIIILGIFFVGLLWISRYYLVTTITNTYNIYVKGESAEILGEINILVVENDSLLIEPISKCHDFGIHLVIFSDKNLECIKLTLIERGIGEKTNFVDFESINLDVSTDLDECFIGYAQYNNTVFYNATKNEYNYLTLIDALQQEFRFIVGFIGVDFHNKPSFRKSDVSITADTNASDVVKDAADLVCLDEGTEAMKNIMNAIEHSQKFHKYVGWVVHLSPSFKII